MSAKENDATELEQLRQTSIFREQLRLFCQGIRNEEMTDFDVDQLFATVFWEAKKAEGTKSNINKGVWIAVGSAIAALVGFLLNVIGIRPGGG